MSADIRIQVPEATIQQIEKGLEGLTKSKESVLKTAVNNTAKKTQKLLAQKASREYAGKIARQNAIISRSDIKKATTGNPSALIKFRSPIHEIKDFHVSSLAISKTTYRSNGKRGGKKIKGNVLKGSPKPLDHAFVVEFKNTDKNNVQSSHISVVSRVPGSKMKNKSKEKLRTLYSPSYKKMIGGDKVYGTSEEEIGLILKEQVAQVMEKVLGGK